VPLSGFVSNALKVKSLLLAPWRCPVMLSVVTLPNAFKVADVVVPGVAIDVMDVHPVGDWPAMELPDIPMQAMPRPPKVSTMRRIWAFRVTPVLAAIELNDLNDNAQFLLEDHDAS
jgi:hypothetical protein